MTSPTVNDMVLMRNREKRAVRDFKSSLWLDGASGLGLADTDPVASWTSRDLDHVAFAQGTAGSRPTFTAATSSVTFAGTDDHLTIAATQLTGVDSRIVALVKTTNIAAEQVVYSQSDKDAAAVYCQVGISSGNYVHYKFNNAGTADELRGNIKLGTGWHVIEWSSSGTKILARVDGEPDDLTVVGGANSGNWFGDLTNDDNSTIGAVILSGGIAGFLEGDIRELVISEPNETWGNAHRLRTTVCRKGGLDNHTIYSQAMLAGVAATVADTTRLDYTRNVFSSDATAIAAGCHDYTIASKSWAYVADVLNQTAIDDKVTSDGAGTDLLLFDFELRNPYTQTATLISEMTTVLETWQAGSARPLGMYNTLPHCAYWGAVLYEENANGTILHDQGLGIQSRWMKKNDEIAAGLLAASDYVCPYAYRTASLAAGLTRAKWSIAAEVSEGVRVANGKPVYPIIGYHIPTSPAIGTTSAAAGAFVQATGVLTPAAGPGWTTNALVGRQVRLGATDWYLIASNTTTTLTVTGTLPVNGNYDWLLSGLIMTEAEWIAHLQYVAALPGVDGLIMWAGTPPPITYTWTDAIAALVAGTGDFEDA